MPLSVHPPVDCRYHVQVLPEHLLTSRLQPSHHRCEVAIVITLIAPRNKRNLPRVSVSRAGARTLRPGLSDHGAGRFTTRGGHREPHRCPGSRRQHH